MEREQIQEKTLQVLLNYVNLDSPEDILKMDDSLSDLGMDSFKVIYMLLDIEETFGIQISDNMLSPELFVSPRSLYDVIISILDKK